MKKVMKGKMLKGMVAEKEDPDDNIIPKDPDVVPVDPHQAGALRRERWFEK